MENNNNIPNSVYDWYSPNFSTAEKPPVDPPKPRRKRTGLKVTLIVLAVLVLVSATAIGFSGVFSFSGSAPQLSEPQTTPEPAEPSEPPMDEDFSELIPGIEESIPGIETELPENFRDFFEGYYTMEESIEPSNIPRTQPVGDFNINLESAEGIDKLSLQELYNNCSPSVVGILTHFSDNAGFGWGTGLIISESGYIVTNAHVITQASGCTVMLFNGKECEALLVGEDAETDLAVLKIESKGLVPVTFGDSEELMVGDEVAAIGNPLDIELSNTLTNGIVSAINRNVEYSGTSMPLIQTTAALNKGNSGGALFNMQGQVVGVTNMKMINNYGTSIEGIGFAIPSTTVKTVVNSIIENGKVMGRPGIGITCGSVPVEAMEKYGLPEGLYITDVSKGSDAEKKGILPGDVLTHINGQAVFTTEDVLEIRDQHQIGDFLHFTIYRDGETLELDVEIYDQGNIY